MSSYSSFQEVYDGQSGTPQSSLSVFNGLQDMQWTDADLELKTGSGNDRRVGVRYRYIDPVEGYIWGSVNGEWAPTEEQLQQLGVTPEMNWYNANPLFGSNEAAAMAQTSTDPASITTTFYPSGYRPGGLGDSQYKTGKSNSVEVGKRKLESMVAKQSKRQNLTQGEEL